MRIAFVDFSGWAYTVDSPYQRPLGGSQSGLCYLAEELTRQGNDVWILNGVPEPVTARGVRVAPIDATGIAVLASSDAVVVLNGCSVERATMLRRMIGHGPMLVYWTQHADDQPASTNLRDPAMRAQWDAFVLISDWQAERYRSEFGLPAERIKVLRNAIGPSFHDMFSSGSPIRAGRGGPPVLAYTSTPFRGLDVLVAAFPLIRAQLPGTTLKVFSSMAVYQVDSGRDQFADLYERCRTTEGIEYVGSLPQPELARALRGVTCLSYPNTFPETSCIAVMEAMAAGCIVATSTLGALPETLAGLGFTLTPPGDPRLYAERFADLAVRVLRLMDEDADRTERYLADQVGLMNATATWTVRARQWAGWLAESTADRWAGRHGLVGGAPLTRRLPSGRVPVGGAMALSTGRHGVYLSNTTTTEGRALQRHGEPDEAVSKLLTSFLRANDTVVEIGAGIGTVTLPIARQVGSGGLVIAVEPRDALFPPLCATLALNGLTQARPVPGPIDGALAGSAAHLTSCRLLRINVCDDETVSLAAILAEAEAVIDRFRPILHCRIRSSEDFAALTATAARFGHRLYWHGHRQLGDADGESRTVVSVLGLSANVTQAIDGVSATTFDEAARLFPGFHTGH
jgi:glycosyltransferase involved in cell wall biosynthesis